MNKVEEIKNRLKNGYVMSIYGTRDNLHNQMTNDIEELLEAINYTHCCETFKEDKKTYIDMEDWMIKSGYKIGD